MRAEGDELYMTFRKLAENCIGVNMILKQYLSRGGILLTVRAGTYRRRKGRLGAARSKDIGWSDI